MVLASMAMRVAIDLGAGGTTAIRYDPKTAGTSTNTLVLAHGAGAGQEHPWMVTVASGLAARGVRVWTFNFPYTEAGRRTPDRTDALLACFRAVVAQVRAESGGPLFIGGKSLGGRMASHLAADGEPGVAGLICLGYPLHPPGRPEQLRVQHLPRIAVPVLIVQGARDAFGTPEELRPYFAQVKVQVTLEVIEGGDHSFKQPKKLVPDPRVTLDHICDVVAGWIAAL
jgi:predicted alpha/beta-hydrolase family hydrolase